MTNSALAAGTLTVSPRAEATADIVNFRDFVRSREAGTPAHSARLIDGAGRGVNIPQELFDVLKLVAESLAAGRAVTLAPVDTQLTSQEAAELLGMSRPTMNKLLDSGVIPCTRIGRHRRVRLSALLEYREHASSTREKALREMAEVAREAGLYGSTAYSAEGMR